MDQAGIPVPAGIPASPPPPPPPATQQQGGNGVNSPRSQSRSPSRTSSFSRRSLSGANSPRYATAAECDLCRLSAVMGSAGVVSSSLPPRRDGVEFRGRAGSVNSVEGSGVERLIESLKHENNECKKNYGELDDRCKSPGEWAN
jgi:hypothetical protein